MLNVSFLLQHTPTQPDARLHIYNCLMYKLFENFHSNILCKMPAPFDMITILCTAEHINQHGMHIWNHSSCNCLESCFTIGVSAWHCQLRIGDQGKA